MRKLKTQQSLIEDIETELALPCALSVLGIAVEVVCPIMDHELKRPELMNTESNYAKVGKYLSSLQELVSGYDFPVYLVSSLDYFGTPSESEEFRSITRAINQREAQAYGFSNQTFEHTVTNEFEHNVVDEDRSDYYRSREFARLCRTFDTGEAFFHSCQMTSLAIQDGCAGVLAHLPTGAQFDMAVFNLSPELVVYS